MYKCERLSKNRITEFRRLCMMSAGFNPLNEDFFENYEKASLTRQLFQRRKVRLLKIGSEFGGFVWYEYYSSNTCGIRALFSIEKDNLDTYRMLLDSIPRCRNIQYRCVDNGYNFSILKRLGFVKNEGEIEMRLGLEEVEKLLGEQRSYGEGLVFKTFEKGKDEGLRCCIQNDIFNDSSRVPLTLNDIFFDVSREYYLEGGSAFLYKDGECIGYGQIVIDSDMPFIVNIGLIPGYRGKGYGRLLLIHFLEIVRDRGFDQVRLNVRSGNEDALRLYRKLGFSIISETYKWQLKR
ncbi:MAG: acetyltransferase [Firmicutes bacterium]|nr:acetyltransferase [Bacillota bacterium]